MSIEVMAAVLVAAVLNASWNALVKGAHDSFVGATLICAGCAAVAIPVMLLRPLPLAASYPFMVASAFVQTGYFVLIAVVYRRADLSVAYPITRGTAPLIATAAAALLLAEWPGLTATFGIVLVCVGVLGIAGEGLRRGGIDGPSLRAALLNALCIASYTIIDGEGGRRSGDPVAYTAWVSMAAALVFLPLAFMLRGRALAAPLLQGWRVALAGGGASFASYGIVIWAMSRAPIGLVAALREASVLFAAAIGAWFLKEPITPARYVAAVLVVGGLACMRAG